MPALKIRSADIRAQMLFVKAQEESRRRRIRTVAALDPELSIEQLMERFGEGRKMISLLCPAAVSDYYCGTVRLVDHVSLSCYTIKMLNKAQPSSSRATPKTCTERPARKGIEEKAGRLG